MDAATLYIIWILSDGREVPRESRQFPSVAACEEYAARVNQRRPTDIPPSRYECWRHYRISPANGLNVGLN